MILGCNIKSTGCLCGKEHMSAVKNVIKGKGAIEQIPNELENIKAKKVFLFADKNTYMAAGEKTEKIIKDAKYEYSKFIFSEEKLEPDEFAVGSIMMHFDKSCDVIIAVGSGVINDIGKILADISGKPYMIVATAPSMDGYASETSSMSMDGLKVSLNSKCADVIIGDTDILKNAPINMLKSGLGDMLAKYISICEWKIAHTITGEYYCEEIAELIRQSLKNCVENAEGLLNRSETAVETVFKGLVIGGIAMAYAGVSRPASGVEHYFSHIWDMRGAVFGTPVEYHGIQCAVGTLISIDLYEKIKKITPDRRKALKYAEEFEFSNWCNELRSFLGKSAESMILLEEKEQKYNPEKHSKRLECIIKNWDEIINIINSELPSLNKIVSLFDKIGLPKTLEEIGLEEKILPMSFKCAKDIRDKYVLPRLCWDLGILDEIVWIPD